MNYRKRPTEWHTELTEEQICDTLMNNGKVWTFMEQLMNQTTHDGYITAIDRDYFLSSLPMLDRLFLFPIKASTLIENELKRSEKTVVYQKKEVGSLMRFEKGRSPHTEGIALVDYLLNLPLAHLSDAQIHELEFLLNRAGTTLGITLPILPPVTEHDKQLALEELAVTTLKDKPTYFYQRFIKMMKASGTPVTMTQKEFLKFAEDTLTTSSES
jgi:hypothetical protein